MFLIILVLFTLVQLFYGQLILPSGSINSPCYGHVCSIGLACQVVNNQPQCKCNHNCDKSRLTGPVCTTNGHTYQNLCELKKDECIKGKYILIEHYGNCTNNDGLDFFQFLVLDFHILVAWTWKRSSLERFNTLECHHLTNFRFFKRKLSACGIYFRFCQNPNFFLKNPFSKHSSGCFKLMNKRLFEFFDLLILFKDFLRTWILHFICISTISFHLFIYLFVYLFIYLFIICLFIYSFIYLFIYLSGNLFVNLFLS